MNKPNNYDNAKAYSTFEPLPAGGYVCKIMQVVETKSSTGKEMIVVSMDIAEGEQKDYYAKAYKEDTREDKKWGCNVYVLTEDAEGNTSRKFKGFIENVKASNAGWNEVWGDKFCDNFKGKLVGAIFGREEYQKQNGDTAWSTKCFYFDAVERIRSGKVKTPQDRYLQQNSGSAAPSGSDGFMNITDGVDEELPF